MFKDIDVTILVYTLAELVVALPRGTSKKLVAGDWPTVKISPDVKRFPP
jgi:hypothetical protein